MNWKFYKKENKIKKESKIKKGSRIIIYLKPMNLRVSWIYWFTDDEKIDIYYPWKDFIKWFHSRKQSQSFRINNSTFCSSFNREDIYLYEISLIEQEE